MKRKVVTLFIVGLLICLQFNIVWAESLNKSANYTNANLEQEIFENIEFRHAFGLVSDYHTIHNLLTEKVEKVKKYGVTLSKEEADILDNRFEKQLKLKPVIKEYLNTYAGSKFAGLYTDQASGGVIYIGLIDDIDEGLKSEVKKMYGSPDKVKYFNAKYSQNELDKFVENVWEQYDTLLKHGIEVRSVSTKFSEQKIVIGVASINDDKVVFLRDHFGDDIIVLEVEEGRDNARNTKYRPLEGGLKIYKEDSKVCTMAFSATAGAKTYAITAGHCDIINNTFSQGGTSYSLTNKIGKVTKRKYGGSVDALAIELDNASWISFYLYANGQSQERKFNDLQLRTEDDEGDTVCISAGNSDATKCGILQTINQTFTFEGTFFSSMRALNWIDSTYTTIGGDSGSPYFLGYTILGVHKGIFGSYNATYSQADRVVSDLSVTAITSP